MVVNKSATFIFKKYDSYAQIFDKEKEYEEIKV
jgi:hypothetical protein